MSSSTGFGQMIGTRPDMVDSMQSVGWGCLQIGAEEGGG